MALDDIHASAQSVDAELIAFESQFIVEKPGYVIPGRPKVLVVGKMVVFLGDTKAPWVGKLVANDGHCIRVHWFRSYSNKLTNKWTKIVLKGGKADEDTYKYKDLPVILDWGFDLEDKKIPQNRIKIIETTVERLLKTYVK